MVALTSMFRIDCFESTFVHLTERFNGKEVFLIGSSNLSTMLAQRTQKLIQDVKPEAVMVQTNEQWWQTAKLLQYVDSQQEFSEYNKDMDKYSSMSNIYMWDSFRQWLFWGRFKVYSALFNFHFRIPMNYTFLKPGLEVKYACEEAEKLGAKTYFLGTEFNQDTYQRLFHETRMTIPHYLYKRIQKFGFMFYKHEKNEATYRMQNSEPSQFTEKCLDPYMVNWFIQNTDIFFPKFKRIFVDQRDEDLFKAIDTCPEKRIVVVVNQFHMEGIEHNWAHRYGQQPRSVHFPEGINPIGDLDLKNGLF